MPLHVPALSRRSFLAQASVTVAGLTVLRPGWGAPLPADPNVFAVLSDTHVPSTPDIAAHGTNMTANIRQVVREVVAHPARPAAVFINGDCAYLKGLATDYANLAECIAPLSQAGLPLHVTMGNHDHRGRLFEGVQSQKPERPVLESKHVTVVESPRANWFLLDSLTETDVVTGEIGVEQRAWLDKALKARSDKPAIVMAHHTPQFEAPAEGKAWGGIKDTREFMDLLAAHRHVKAFVYGHSHVWETKRRGPMHLVNLPPVAYVFKEGLPNGWVEARIRENGLDLNLRAINPGHPLHNQKVSLDWA
jgi:3',5'-cyclic AMP phosphodiesterase CpdA